MQLKITPDKNQFKVSFEGRPDHWITRENIEALLQWLEQWHVRKIQEIEDRLTEIEFWDASRGHHFDLTMSEADQRELFTLIQEQAAEAAKA